MPLKHVWCNRRVFSYISGLVFVIKRLSLLLLLFLSMLFLWSHFVTTSTIPCQMPVTSGLQLQFQTSETVTWNRGFSSLSSVPVSRSIVHRICLILMLSPTFKNSFPYKCITKRFNKNWQHINYFIPHKYFIGEASNSFHSIWK